MQTSNFIENLRYACSQKHSVSQICREIGLNRQQFNRYINGSSKPSAYNLNRIARYFALQPADFETAPSLFSNRLEKARKGNVGKDPIEEGFPGDIRALRRHLGYYQTYHISLSWPDSVICSCSRLEEQDGQIISKSIERIRNVELEITQFVKYKGKVAYMRDRIFLLETAIAGDPIISQTVLLPFQEHQQLYLKGLCTGISWRNQNLPYATLMIWRYLGTNPDKRAMLGRCGIISPRSRRLSPTVKKFLLSGNMEKAMLQLP
ncbi:helix-turn-helix transcriptional regulator [uncultured Cohaesibacter sp.]|uniref:helix-turn-helix domain-containing protein n=1 Tax=uncultured Cohaesibacter sp. TaxID=1002546 RepID=UPI0029C9AA62|nr:helix-turn-helix transcriptional regulator [uncultured Cohaesibacter sp.]